MRWIAALPMYDLSPRLRGAHEALLAALLAQADICDSVEVLAAAPLPELWLRPDLLLSQTCGYPWLKDLRGHAPLLATPCYDVPGCDGTDYTSVIVARAGSGIATLADARGGTAAANDRASNSGMNALRHAAAPLARGTRFFGGVRWSGSHAASLRMVREREADIAAIDCVTYAYLRDEDPANVAGIVELGYTAAAPALPFIAGRAVPPALAARLRAALLEPEAPLRGAMAALRIGGFRYRAEAEYGRIARLEDIARAAGYPELA